MKVTPLEKYLIQQALRETRELLLSIKRKTRRGKDLEDLQILEDAAQHLECFNVATYQK